MKKKPTKPKKNNVYKQDKSECTLYAACNALEKQKGIVIPEDSIEKFFDEHGLARSGGQPTLLVLNLLKAYGIDGYKPKAFNKVYTITRGSKNKAIDMMNFKKLANEHCLIFCLYHREKDERGAYYPLDENHVLKPLKTPIKQGGHAVFVDSAEKLFKLENSKGEEFGERGFFYLAPEDFWTEVYQVYRIVW